VIVRRLSLIRFRPSTNADDTATGVTAEKINTDAKQTAADRKCSTWNAPNDRQEIPDKNPMWPAGDILPW